MDYCWHWQGSYFENGYGQVWSPTLKRATQAHRFVYEELVGPIPAGLQLDHLCRTRGCVNPKHLRVVTCRENILAPGSTCLAAKNAVKTHCPAGHAYDEANTYVTRRRLRQCRTCKIAKKRMARISARGISPVRDAAKSSGAGEAVITGSSPLAILSIDPPGEDACKSLRIK